VIRDDGREVQRYPDKDIRISILWKGAIRPGTGRDDEGLTAENEPHPRRSPAGAVPSAVFVRCQALVGP
jgi:hypothetical protein